MGLKVTSSANYTAPMSSVAGRLQLWQLNDCILSMLRKTQRVSLSSGHYLLLFIITAVGYSQIPSMLLEFSSSAILYYNKAYR
jgi:hypothetical protein